MCDNKRQDTKDCTKEYLKRNFELTAQGYVKLLCKMWHLDESYGYWVADEIGGVWCYGDTHFVVTYDDLRVLVEQDVTFDVFNEYDEYCSWAIEFGQIEPNLSAWLNGCPRHSKATMERIKAMKVNLDTELAKLRDNL